MEKLSNHLFYAMTQLRSNKKQPNENTNNNESLIIKTRGTKY